MALRSLTTRMWVPAAASALRRNPGPVVPPACSRFVCTSRNANQNDNDIWRKFFDVGRIRDDVKRYKTEDEIMRENLRWFSRFYKGVEWSGYVILSVYAALLIACEVVVRSRKDKGDKGHVRPT